jgi:hypothetical protein
MKLEPEELMSEETDKSIKRVELQLSLYNDLISVSKSLKQTTQQYSAGDGGGPAIQHSYRGMGIKHLQQQRKHDDTTND